MPVKAALGDVAGDAGGHEAGNGAAVGEAGADVGGADGEGGCGDAVVQNPGGGVGTDGLAQGPEIGRQRDRPGQEGEGGEAEDLGERPPRVEEGEVIFADEEEEPGVGPE